MPVAVSIASPGSWPKSPPPSDPPLPDLSLPRRCRSSSILASGGGGGGTRTTARKANGRTRRSSGRPAPALPTQSGPAMQAFGPRQRRARSMAVITAGAAGAAGSSTGAAATTTFTSISPPVAVATAPTARSRPYGPAERPRYDARPRSTAAAKAAASTTAPAAPPPTHPASAGVAGPAEPATPDRRSDAPVPIRRQRSGYIVTGRAARRASRPPVRAGPSRSGSPPRRKRRKDGARRGGRGRRRWRR